MQTATRRDPRSIITPDAFDVAAELVGTPLAEPRHRAAALAIDGVVIGFITLVTKSFALILGVVAAVFFMRAGFRRTTVRGSVFGKAMRFSVGCLGVFIALITAALWSAFGFGFGGEDRPSDEQDIARIVGGALASAGLFRAFDAVGSAAEAEEMAADFIEAAEATGLDRPSIRAALLAAVPDSATWGEEWEQTVDRLLADPETVSASSEVPGSADTFDIGVIAADTLRVLSTRIASLEVEVDDRTAELEDVRAELEEATGGGVFGWIRERLDDLGFGFGWAALYMTIVLSWWNGQTVGKKLMGLRVVRLDGEPITWWVAFERAGGYAAGFATGLLGFAQVWWDANRQAIHDRIVGTVVVIDKADRILDWEAQL